VKLGIGAVLAMLFLALTFSIHVPGALAANTHTPCARSDQGYVVVEGDTLSWIAFRYHMNWSALASYDNLANPNLIYVDQTVCIPVQGFVPGTQVQQVRTVPHHTVPKRTASIQMQHVKPVTQNTPQPQATPKTVPPVVQPPTSTPVTSPPPPSTGSIPAMIEQVFGANGAGAINVARCESGLNPAAYNPSGAMGLFQIMPGTWAGTSQAGQSPYNAQANIIAAHDIFVRDGYSWREWTCQP